MHHDQGTTHHYESGSSVSNDQPPKKTIFDEDGNVIELSERFYAHWRDLVFLKKETSPEQPADGDRSTSES